MRLFTMNILFESFLLAEKRELLLLLKKAKKNLNKPASS